MTVPPSTKHQLLVKGPSQSKSFDHLCKYNAKIGCDATASVLKNEKTVLEADKEKRASYWLLVFPPHVLFDNLVFSSDNTRVKKQHTGVAFNEDEVGVGPGINHNVSWVYWFIAEKHDGSLVEEEEEEDEGAGYD